MLGSQEKLGGPRKANQPPTETVGERAWGDNHDQSSLSAAHSTSRKGTESWTNVRQSNISVETVVIGAYAPEQELNGQLLKEVI